MKLILKEYLSSLKERDELDAIMPDLLSEMGMNVFSRPQRGTRQNGVDIAATGKDSKGKPCVFLFSLKDGDLDRKHWNNNSLQSLRPSLDEILDTFIPTRLPIEHQNKPIIICLCFGGDVLEQVRTDLKGYIDRNTTSNISYEEWNGDKIAELIIKHFLKEDLLPNNFRVFLRKSLSMIEEPEVSYKFFGYLTNEIIESDQKTIKKLRQLNISLWILYSWCRTSENIEAAFLGAELVFLKSWDIIKSNFHKKTKSILSEKEVFESIFDLYRKISQDFLINKIIPHTKESYILSNAIHGRNKFDVNLKMFDILGRMSIEAFLAYWEFIFADDYEEKKEKAKYFLTLLEAIQGCIENNPVLYTPYKDEQAIDISLAMLCFSLSGQHHDFVNNWIKIINDRVEFSFAINSSYPCTLNEYHQLIEHPISNDQAYKEEVTAGSILYPMLSIFSALLKLDDRYKELQELKNKHLKHCNWQVLFWRQDSEEKMTTSDHYHGAAYSNIPISKPEKNLLKLIFTECDQDNSFENYYAIKHNLHPIILVACRHFRHPIPLNFIKMSSSIL